MKVVGKFGGTSVAGGDRMKHVAKLVSDMVEEHRVVVVVSAMDGVTDRLIELAGYAEKGRRRQMDSLLKRIRVEHLKAVREGTADQGFRREVESRVMDILRELTHVSTGVAQLKELTPRSRDYILSFGERLSTSIVEGVFKESSLKIECFTGGEAGIVTDSNFGEAKPLMDVSKHLVGKRLNPLLENGVVPVVTGFIAVDQHGVTTTLGRGGSDYTATILGVAVEANEVWLWTDVDGLMTSDPRVVSSARVIESISFPEAVEMALMGAKGMHPRALEPVMEAGIPVRIRNTFNPSNPGTRIMKDVKMDSERVAKAVNLVKNVGLVTVTGVSMVGAPGTAAKVFGTLAKEGVNIMMISQNVSEASISMVVSKGVLSRAVNALELDLLGAGVVKEVSWEDDVCVLALVGVGMKGTPGVAARVFNAVAKQGVNVRMIAQGSSELSISFVVKASDASRALQAVHEEFKLGEG